MAESKKQVFTKVKELAGKIAFHEAQATIHADEAAKAGKELEEYLEHLSLGTRIIQKAVETTKKRKKAGKAAKTFSSDLITQTMKDILGVVGNTPMSITSVSRATNHSPALTKAAMKLLVDDESVIHERFTPDYGPSFMGYRKP